MKLNNYTVAHMHQILDEDGNGHVDRMEFVTGLERMNIMGLTKKDYNTIFEHIDIDGNGFLSVNEFGLFLEGATLTRQQKIAQMPQNMIDEVTRDINDLFDKFDEDGNQHIDAEEIQTAMKGMGFVITYDKALEMIDSVDQDGDHQLNRQEFQDLMKPIMIEQLISTEDNVEEIRAIFREADTDYSGYLTADEVYAVLLK